MTYFALCAVFPKKTSYILPIYSCMLALFQFLITFVSYRMLHKFNKIAQIITKCYWIEKENVTNIL